MGERAGTVIAHQTWRDVVMLHWRAPAGELQARLPAGLEVDLRDGEAWVSLFVFEARATRPRLLPELVGLSFVEANLRTYVISEAGEPGVYFFSMDAGSALVTMAARALTGLPYFHARGVVARDGGAFEYQLARASGARPRSNIRVQPLSPPRQAEPGSLEHFLLERYVLFVEHGGRLLRGPIEHEKWIFHEAAVLRFDDQLASAAGLGVERPQLAHYATGRQVDIHRLTSVTRREAMENQELIELCNDLIHLDMDAISAYESAIKGADHEIVKTQLSTFQADHLRHVRDLEAIVRSLGGTPSVRKDAKGFFIKGFTALTSIGTHSALMAMRGNEELTIRTYRNALEHAALPGELHFVIERNYQDEQRHLEWIRRAIDEKLWEEQPGASPTV